MKNLNSRITMFVLSMLAAVGVVCAAESKIETHKHRIIVSTDCGANHDGDGWEGRCLKNIIADTCPQIGARKRFSHPTEMKRSISNGA